MLAQLRRPFSPQSSALMQPSFYTYWLSLENGSDQLIVYALSIYPSVHKKLIRTIFEAHIVH